MGGGGERRRRQGGEEEKATRSLIRSQVEGLVYTRVSLYGVEQNPQGTSPKVAQPRYVRLLLSPGNPG
jgi:hypothetical protein